MMEFSSNIIPIDRSRQEVTLSNGLHHEPPMDLTESTAESWSAFERMGLLAGEQTDSMPLL